MGVIYNTLHYCNSTVNYNSIGLHACIQNLDFVSVLYTNCFVIYIHIYLYCSCPVQQICTVELYWLKHLYRLNHRSLHQRGMQVSLFLLLKEYVQVFQPWHFFLTRNTNISHRSQDISQLGLDITTNLTLFGGIRTQV